MSNEQPPPRPVAPPGQISTPDQLPTVEPGEWPAQPPRRAVPPPTPPTSTPVPPPPPLGPPAPPYVPPAPRSLAWLWVTLAAVVALVVCATTTVVVLHPWKDDPEPAAAPGGSERAGPSDSAPATPSTTPSAPPTSAAPTQPVPVVPVTSDLDGDGFGDAAAVVGKGKVQRLVLSSTGTSFTVARESVPAFEDRTWADFDGDGALDQVSWTYQLSGELTLTSVDQDFPELDLPLRLAKKWPYVTLKPGDFDGDGAVDLVAYGESGPREVAIWVLRNNGQGFDEPVEWARLGHTTYVTTALLTADFTGDVRTDVVVRRPVRSGRLGFTLLASTGAAFLSGRTDHPTPFLDVADVVIGDFAGDGTPILLLVGPGRHGVRVEGLRMSGTQVAPDHSWDADVGGSGRHVVDAAVSDVDGDGIDDVVYATSGGKDRSLDAISVLRSTGARIEPSETWAPAPRCRALFCAFYFENSY